MLQLLHRLRITLRPRKASKLNEEYADCLVKVMKAIQEDGTVEYDSDDSDDEETKKKMIESIRQSLKGDQMARH